MIIFGEMLLRNDSKIDVLEQLIEAIKLGRMHKGLCDCIWRLRLNCEISERQSHYASNLLFDYKNSDEFEDIYGDYYWEPKLREPRIKFLTDHLNKLKTR